MRSWKCRITDASTVVVACFFLRQPLEIDSGTSKAGTRQRVVRRPNPLAGVVLVPLVSVDHDGLLALQAGAEPVSQPPTPGSEPWLGSTGTCARTRPESSLFGLLPLIPTRRYRSRKGVWDPGPRPPARRNGRRTRT